MNRDAADGNLVLAEAAGLSVDMFDRFYHDVLEPAFPPEELEDIDVVRETHHNPDARVPGLVAMSGGNPVGGALGEYYPRGAIMLLAYLAVRRDLRGTGVGTALLAGALPAWRQSVPARATVAEVEDPRFHQPGPHGDPVARLRFYERAGAKLLPVPYVQPSVGRGMPPVAGMFLICLDPWLESIRKDDVLAFLDEYVESAGGGLGAPDYRALRGRIESKPADISLWPMSRAADMPIAYG
jgi:GNAT superfamily N-acetyltransferase